MSGTWGAGLVGPDGTDYVAEQSAALRERMGKGLFSTDPHGTMGQWLDFMAIPLALLRNFIDWIIANGNPGTADGLLEHWETILGLGFHSEQMSIAQRQQRCKERLRRWATYPGGPTSRPAWAGYPTEWCFWALFYTIHFRELGIGPVSFLSTGPCEWTLTVSPDMYDPPHAYALGELTFLRDALCPAWGRIIITA